MVLVKMVYTIRMNKTKDSENSESFLVYRKSLTMPKCFGIITLDSCFIDERGIYMNNQEFRADLLRELNLIYHGMRRVGCLYPVDENNLIYLENDAYLNKQCKYYLDKYDCGKLWIYSDDCVGQLLKDMYRLHGESRELVLCMLFGYSDKYIDKHMNDIRTIYEGSYDWYEYSRDLHVFFPERDINNENAVKFISYDGEYPMGCKGTLTLNINGEVVTFSDENEQAMYPAFWSVGGNSIIDQEVDGHKAWICIDSIPKKYKRYFIEIEREFNANVVWGCCGDCQEGSC